MAGVALAGCSSGSPEANPTDSTTGATEEATPSATPLEDGFNPGAKVTMTFWAWDPGMDHVVAAWNKANPDVQVKLENPAGGDELVTQMNTAHQAGNGPDIGKIEYQALPSLISAGVVVPMDDYIKDVNDAYPDNVWALTRFDGKTYGLAQDFAPMMFFYREDIFAANNIAVPTTWEQYAEAAKTLHAADPSVYLGTFSAGDPGWFAGLTQQANANWWSYKDNAWNVDINSSESKKVADYWQGLINEGSIKKDPFWTPQWIKEMDGGNYAGWIAGAWASAQIRGFAASTADKWRVAPLPTWGTDQTGIWGGSAMSVMADSKHPKEAADFIKWLNTSKEGLSLQVTDIGVYPAATVGRTLPELQTPPEFFKSQSDYYDVIAKSADVATSFDVWGPDANVTFNSYRDEFSKAAESGSSFSGALDTMQSVSVESMKKLGFTVNN